MGKPIISIRNEKSGSTFSLIKYQWTLFANKDGDYLDSGYSATVWGAKAAARRKLKKLGQEASKAIVYEGEL